MEYELVLKSSLNNNASAARDVGQDQEQNNVDAMELCNWVFLDEHPGKVFACLKKMKRIKVPLLYYKKDLPDLEYCKIYKSDMTIIDQSVINAQNEYAAIILLHVYPFLKY